MLTIALVLIGGLSLIATPEPVAAATRTHHSTRCWQACDSSPGLTCCAESSWPPRYWRGSTRPGSRIRGPRDRRTRPDRGVLWGMLAMGFVGGLAGAALAPRITVAGGAALAAGVFGGMGLSLAALWFAPSVALRRSRSWRAVPVHGVERGGRGRASRATPTMLDRVGAVSRTVILLASLLAALAGGWFTARCVAATMASRPSRCSRRARSCPGACTASRSPTYWLPWIRWTPTVRWSVHTQRTSPALRRPQHHRATAPTTPTIAAVTAYRPAPNDDARREGPAPRSGDPVRDRSRETDAASRTRAAPTCRSGSARPPPRRPNGLVRHSVARECRRSRMLAVRVIPVSGQRRLFSALGPGSTTQTVEPSTGRVSQAQLTTTRFGTKAQESACLVGFPAFGAALGVSRGRDYRTGRSGSRHVTSVGCEFGARDG